MIAIPCPVCGFQSNVRLPKVSEKREERIQHRDHYYFLDLPYPRQVYEEHIGPSGTKETRQDWKFPDPKPVSSVTVDDVSGIVEIDLKDIEIMAAELGVELSGVDSKALPQESLSRIALSSLADEHTAFWRAIEYLVSNGFIQEANLGFLREILDDAGYELRETRIVLNLPPIRDSKIRPRSQYIRTFREKVRFLKPLYSEYFLNLLAVRHKDRYLLLHADIILSDRQRMKVNKSVNTDDRFLVCCRAFEFKGALELDKMLQNGTLFVDGYKVDFVSPNLNSWGDVQPSQAFPSDLNIEQTEGFGLRLAGAQIMTIFQTIGLSTREEIIEYINSSTSGTFKTFKNFTIATISQELDLGYNSRAQIIAPF